MSLLYGEVTSEQKTMLDSHLESCAECRAQVETWQRASRQLTAWKMPAPTRRRSSVPLLKFAAAAAIVTLGVLGGVRLFVLNHEMAQLRAELKREVADRNTALAQIDQQAAKAAAIEAQALMTEFAKALEEKRLEDRQLVLATLQQIQTKHAENYTALRKELATVAVLTEAGLRYAHNEIANINFTTDTK